MRKKPFPDAAESRTPFWAVGLLGLAVLAAYADSFSGPFFFDDSLAIANNPSIRHLWPPWAPLLPPGGLTVGGRPILNLTFALNYAGGGLTVWGYHAVNLAIHLLAGLTLLGVMRRTLLQPVLRDKFGADALPLALAIALLWALHPLQTESVTYISQRAEALMGLFYLLTLYALIRGAGSARDQWRWPVIGVAACGLGMATKEVMATAPLMALLYDRTFLAGSFREAWRRRRRLYAGLAASWAVLAYAFLDVGQRDVGFGRGVTPWTYAVTECGAVVHYLGLVFWPHPLVIDYGPGMVSDPRQVVPQALLLAALVTVTAIAFVRRPAAGFAGVWFFLILAVTSSVIPVVVSPMAEHRLYLPLAAPVALLVLGLYAWIGRWSLLVAAALALAGGVLTFERNADYRSEIALWQQAADLYPNNARARTNLSYVLLQKGRVREALAECQKALEIDPNVADIRNNVGNALWQNGQLDEALDQYQAALKIKPNDAEARYNLGNVLLQKGRVDEAVSQYQEALGIDPNYTDVHNNLGKAFVQKGQMDDALSQFQTALEIDPANAEAHNNLGNVLLQKGHVDEAIAQYQAVLQIDPTSAVAQRNLAKAQGIARPVPGSK